MNLRMRERNGLGLGILLELQEVVQTRNSVAAHLILEIRDSCYNSEYTLETKYYESTYTYGS